MCVGSKRLILAWNPGRDRAPAVMQLYRMGQGSGGGGGGMEPDQAPTAEQLY